MYFILVVLCPTRATGDRDDSRTGRREGDDNQVGLIVFRESCQRASQFGEWKWRGVG